MTIDRPKHILFLCVANSARSQLAEGLARALAPPGVQISSAGSAPTSVRPEAIQVLSEAQIPTTGQHSKPIDAIDLSSVDLVVTLCADEVCPVVPSRAVRLHWPMADPAAVTASEPERLEAFRQTRDELRRRLEGLVAGPPSGGNGPHHGGQHP